MPSAKVMSSEATPGVTNLRRAVIGRRHLLEMELRHSGFLRDGGSEMRPADIGTQRFSPALVAD